ncbi:MAG: C39 family peptidase [Planctomycetes bacterium]|nr:C39 family peptidase [Planctomycetota bacterium]
MSSIVWLGTLALLAAVACGCGAAVDEAPTGSRLHPRLLRLRTVGDATLRMGSVSLDVTTGAGLLILPRYADGTYARQGVCAVGGLTAVGGVYDRAVLSWTATLPRGTGLRLAFSDRPLVPPTDSLELAPTPGFLPVLAWLPSGEHRSGEKRTASSDGASVDVDTIKPAQPADVASASVWVTLTSDGAATPVLHSLTLSTWVARKHAPFAVHPSPAWGRVLAVPERSQCVEDPAIAGSICSPTSLAMVLEFWGVSLPTAEVARGVYDAQAAIYGNWPFNTAFAFEASAGRLRESYVVRFAGLEDLEAEILACRPVIISHRWKKSELTGAPVESSDGHLIVVVGFDANGDVVVNDPAADPRRGGRVRRVYPRREMFRTWMENADGIAYRIGPE